MVLPVLLPQSHFNPRTPVGCDVLRPAHRLGWEAFQSTHPSGVRPAMKNAIMLQFKFQSTHPSGVRRGRCADPRLIVEFQSTHPSGVRPSFRWRVSFFYAISIHAPQWGATGQRGWNLGHSVISIHAPQWGATRARSRLAPRRLHFNPRTPVGCDAFPDRYRFGVDISIHAPQWGATRAGEGGHLVTGDISIHAPQWGATAYFCTVPEAPLFQSTHPSGVRPITALRDAQRLWISIHAPQWGATLVCFQSAFRA